MPPEKKNLLFVYGTLRPKLASGGQWLLIKDLVCVGKATVKGILYDLGPYPAMKHGEGVVVGDLLHVPEPIQFDALDEYEGANDAQPLYTRERVTATRNTGEELAVWGYFYNGSVDGREVIRHGDYEKYLLDKAN